MGWLAGGPAKMASTNKCLAESNKSPDGPGATKGALTVQRQMFGHIRWSFRQCLVSGSGRFSSAYSDEKERRKFVTGSSRRYCLNNIAALKREVKSGSERGPIFGQHISRGSASSASQSIEQTYSGTDLHPPRPVRQSDAESGPASRMRRFPRSRLKTVVATWPLDRGPNQRS
jgi:hypothetical protein